ncbi:MAG: (4Fe-4S)-binding protein, partial [Bacillota bacterium]
IHARLKAGAENSGKLVTEVRDIAEKRAKEKDKELVLVDGSPGIGCPVIASLNGVDMALIVTEPTKSGLSDLKRVLEMIEHFDLTASVVINKYDLNKNMADNIEKFCDDNNIEVLARIPYSPVFVELLREGRLLVEEKRDSQIGQLLQSLWSDILEILD